MRDPGAPQSAMSESLHAALEAGSHLPSAALAVFESRSDYLDYRKDHAASLEARWRCGRDLDHLAARPGELGAWCVACREMRTMAFTSGRANLREELVCNGCGLNARMRGVADLTRRLASRGDGAGIYATEQTTLFYRWLKSTYPKAAGSEYSHGGAAERRKGWLRHLMWRRERLNFEDVTDLSFADGSKGLVISCDVLEHVPDYPRALSEFARVLEPGGWLLLTAPFMDQHQDTAVRAGIDEQGRVEHYLEPEYHVDPTRPDGVLAFYSFGWDLLDAVRRAGFARAAWCLGWSRAHGFPGMLWTLVARR